MPVSFLSTPQRERYGRYPDTLSSDELARYFHLDDDDLEWIATKRRDSHRLGYALQLTTVRFLGIFLEDPTAVPGAVLDTLSSQLGIVDAGWCAPSMPGQTRNTSIAGAVLPGTTSCRIRVPD